MGVGGGALGAGGRRRLSTGLCGSGRKPCVSHTLVLALTSRTERGDSPKLQSPQCFQVASGLQPATVRVSLSP